MLGEPTIYEIVAKVRQSSMYWAPEWRAAKLLPYLEVYGEPLYDALKALPDDDRKACGIDLIQRKRSA